MLQIRDISKTYITGDLEQKALDHVSLDLRDNEFIAILGPSGSGKTTFLNIVGGLDRYDSGDIIINGISTKKYKEKDWDAYRNHTIGFVFQSYNLIPHQSILKNVELALTISGISASERKARAIEALDMVGLKEQMHKRPSQMSGGQMQRVAIARALINNPDILLADEPTGALDSDTSIQVMDLLKEVAKDRLVVMVTHNPELAEKYATRIVTLKDGRIQTDTDPYVVSDVKDVKYESMGKSFMSFFTALNLSFNNLWTKRARTILVSLAGSIGIIGIALILSLSNGVNDYIRSIEEDTLSEYPLTIQSTGFNFTSLMVDRSESDGEEEIDGVREAQMARYAFSSVNANDLRALKQYFESDDSNIEDYTKTIEYSYDIVPQIYYVEDDAYRKVNPDTTFSSIGLGASSTNNSLMSMMMSTDVFYALPKTKALYENQYDVKAGHWPTNNHEMVLVLTDRGSIPDMVLYAMGFKDPKEIDHIVEQFAKDETISIEQEDPETYAYEDFLGVSFKLMHSADYYEYDEKYKVYVDKSDNKDFMQRKLNEAEDLTIVGVVKPKEDANVSMLMMGINYPSELQEDMIRYAEAQNVVRAQLADKEKDVITGNPFGEEGDNAFSMDSLFTVDEDALKEAFKFDPNQISMDPTAMNINIDPNSMQLQTPDLPDMDISNLMSNIEVDEEEMQNLTQEVLLGYLTYLNKNYSTELGNIQNSLQDYLRSTEAREIITNHLTNIMQNSIQFDISQEDLMGLVQEIMAGYQVYIQGQTFDTQEEIFNSFQTYLASQEAQAIVSAKLNELAGKVVIGEMDEGVIDTMIQELSTGFQQYVMTNLSGDINTITNAFSKYLALDSTSKTIEKGVEIVINTETLEQQLSTQMQSIAGTYTASIEQQIRSIMNNVTGQITNSMTQQMGNIGAQLEQAFTVNPEAFSKAIQVDMSEKDLQELMISMMSKEVATYDNNLKKLGYTNLDKPSMISIYPLNFNAKEEVICILDDYNDRMRDGGHEDRIINYTDTVGVLMSSVTTIIDTISYILVAFVAISLIVSSIMIGVITYISVLERKKEIGILRAIGASKKNISEVFNAETFIIGLCAGLFGIGITYLLLIPINAIVHHLTGNYNVNAFLQTPAAIILIALSVILTLIGGIIPARKAAKMDPVEALHSE